MPTERENALAAAERPVGADEKVDFDEDNDPEETMEEEYEYEEVEEEEEDEEEVIEEEVEEEVEGEEEDDTNDAPDADAGNSTSRDGMKIEDEDEKKKQAELLALPPHGSEVYIGGISHDASENDLRGFCESIGEVTEVLSIYVKVLSCMLFVNNWTDPISSVTTGPNYERQRLG